jgi:Endoplasmic Reticulum Oxidoreductin 1 (ERO1)
VSKGNGNSEELQPGMAAIDAGVGALHADLDKLRTQPYFRYYSVDLLGSCEYMPQELFECYAETCEIYPEDEASVRLRLRFLWLLFQIARVLYSEPRVVPICISASRNIYG